MAEDIYEIEDGKLKVTKEVVEVKEQFYDYQALLDQLERVQAQQDNDNACREKEKEEVNSLITKAKELSLDKASVAVDTVAAEEIK